ncbi:MAG: DUF402 domain-containing protein [bacterium]
MKVREIKHSPDGETLTFICEALYLGADMAVLRYVSDRVYSFNNITLPPGTVTEGYYWRDRNFLCWKLTGPDGKLLGHRFDICEIIRIGGDVVEWMDLALDLWVDAGGEARFLDEDEVESYRIRGALTPSQLDIISHTKEYLMGNYPAILEEVGESGGRKA